MFLNAGPGHERDTNVNATGVSHDVTDTMTRGEDTMTRDDVMDVLWNNPYASLSDVRDPHDTHD